MRRYKLMMAGLLVLVPVFGWVSVTHAQSFRSGDNTVVTSEETVDGTLYAAGQTVDIAGTVNGDVFCAGQTVTITGTVNGDIICAGQTVRVGGTINGSVRVAGQTVTIDAEINRNLTAAGQTVTIDGASTTIGDASLGGQDVVVNGSIGRDVVSGATNLSVNGVVGRNVQVGVERLKLGGKSQISGDVLYTSKQMAVRERGAEVGGQLTRQEPKDHQQAENLNAWPFVFWTIVSLIVMTLVLLLVAPSGFERLSSIMLAAPGKAVLAGFIASIVVPVGIIILFVTLIGIPLGLVALTTWLLAVMLAGPIAAYSLGKRLLASRTSNVFWYGLVGATLLLVLCILPFIGWIFTIVAFWFGIGSIVLWANSAKSFVYTVPQTKVHIENKRKDKTA